MKITTWNIQHGGGKRIHSIIESIKNHVDTDIFILTEYRNNPNSDLLKSEFKKNDYSYQYTIDSPANINSVLIVSKAKFEATIFDELEEHKNRIIRLQNADFIIYGCYFPLNEFKRKVFEFLLKEIETNVDKNIIIAGDYNTGKHYLDENGATFIDADYLDKFEDRGLLDIWRHLNPGKKEFSWFSNGGNGFRLDHFYIHQKLKERVINCYYEHSYREEKISDHSMMTLELKKSENNS